ncbi:MAG: U32 family peptidase [Verrucomicrobiaceae bacterium]
MNVSSSKPELLSPAGNWDCARAAVANGADAIYFGLPRFNARLRADNFTAEDLPGLMEFLHKHGVRGYCAFNTLIFTSELADAARQLELLEDAGVDAVIIQDIGLARMVKAIAPRLHLHASTQMTITSPEGLRFARKLGLDLAVLARELSLRELERFQMVENPLPLEVFVHGALCVAYSGQCLTSESLGRRSANRGECAQACRMPYELIVDGVVRDLGDKRYLLSPQDLAAVEEIPRLIEVGVKSFKIEGRLKTPEYVAAVTQVYRKSIDAACGNPQSVIQNPKSDDRYALEMSFSRGLYPGWMHGVNHQELVGARFGKKRGPLLGEVRGVFRDAVELTDFLVPLKPGDGVVFENPADTDHEQGGYVFTVQGRILEFRHGKIDFTAIREGTRVYKTSDPAMERALQSTYKGEILVRKNIGLHLSLSGRAGAPLMLEALDENQQSIAHVESAIPLNNALKKPLTRDLLHEQLNRLGGTPFFLQWLDVNLEGEVILPVSELNRMRRVLVMKLETSPAPQKTDAGERKPVLTEMLATIFAQRDTANGETASRLHVLCRSNEQIMAALNLGVSRVYVDFEDVRLFAAAVQLVRQHGSDTEVFLATPRIQKPGEAGYFKLITRAKPDGVLVRNLGAIEFFAAAGLRMTGDFSLNVANPLSAEFLINSDFDQVTVSYDLNIDQALELLRSAPPAWFELTLHQHMPMFHMEHCVFAAFMSDGKTSLDCGRPCEKHQVKLRDRVGMEHPLKADVGCRNTLFNAVPQTGARFFGSLKDAGLRCFRVELLEEDEVAATRVISLYQELLQGTRGNENLWRELKAQSKLGVTSGTLRDA